MALAGRLEEIGGVEAHDLYELRVVKPAPHTFYLARVDLEGIDGHDWLGLVSESSGAARISAIGGQGQSSVTLTLRDENATYGQDGGLKRFSAHFVEPVAGYAEPYDLRSARLLIRHAVKERDGTWSVRDVASYKIDPPSIGFQ